MSNNIKIKSDFNFKDLDKKIVDEITEITLINSSQEAILRASEKAPYLTWTLRKSIGAEPSRITRNTKKIIVWPRKVDYADNREYINFKNPDRKFYMKRTFWEMKGFVNMELEQATQRVLKKYKLK